MEATSEIQTKCELLLAAYRAKGRDPSSDLLPPASHAELLEVSAWFPAALPDPLLELYSWHNGQPKDAWDTEPERIFWFRDMQFTSLERAALEYRSLMESYGADDYWNEAKGVSLRSCFPFAAFNGGWYVVPCAGQRLDPRHSLPVISVFQGVDIHFYSLSQMLDTCIEWREASTWNDRELWYLDEADENRIWRKHNPGIFENAI